MADDELTPEVERDILAGQKEEARALLSCIKLSSDLDKLQTTGVTTECFKPFDNFAEVFDYVIGKVSKGTAVQRADVRRLYNVELLTGVGDLVAYAEKVVEGYRERATIKAIEQYAKDAEKGGVTEAIRALKNKLSYITLNMNHRVGVLMGGEEWIDVPDPLEWLIEGVLPAKWPTFFFGRGGVAKSYLLLLLGCCIASGQTFMARPVKQRNVLYLDWEMDYLEFYTRLDSVAKGLGIESYQPNPETGRSQISMPGLFYVNMDAPLKDKLSDIYEMIAEWDIGLVIIDSFGFSMGEGREIEKSSHALDYMSIVASIPCSVAIIDHVSKMKESDGTPFGSVYKLNSCRWAWWITAVSNPEPEDNEDKEWEPGTYQKWKNTKHNMGPRSKDVYTMLAWERQQEDGRYFKLKGRYLTEDSAPPELVGEKSKRKTPADELGGCSDACYFELTSEPSRMLSRTELIAQTDYHHSAVDNAIKSLVDKGLVTRKKEKYKGGQHPEVVVRALREKQDEKMVSTETVDIDQELDL